MTDTKDVKDTKLFEAIKKLHSLGAKFNYWAIKGAACTDDVELFKWMVENDENKYIDRVGDARCILKAAAEKGCLNVVKFLHEKKVKGNWETIEIAMLGGHFPVVKFLVENFDIKNDIVLDKAASIGHLEMVKYLIANGARCTRDAFVNSLKKGYFEILNVLCAAFPDRASEIIIGENIFGNKN